MHTVGCAEPAGQKLPGSQRSPDASPAGWLLVAAPLQKYPAEQLPVGAVRPDPRQNWPTTQSRHSVSALAPSLGLYVPGGHRNSLPLRVLDGQYAPGGHVTGTDVPLTQKDPSGQAWHTAARSAPLYVPAAHSRGTTDPTGQYEPRGQGPPDSVSVEGVAVVPRNVQKYPAAQGPLVWLLPASAQYAPPSHDEHSLCTASPDRRP